MTRFAPGMGIMVAAAGFLLAALPVARANSYYSVVDLGSARDVRLGEGPGGQGVVTNTATGASYRFDQQRPTTPLPPFLSNAPLPSVPGIDGVANPVWTTFQMRPAEWDSQGTVVGYVPSGESRANPWMTVSWGYTQLQPDGTFSAFRLLPPPGGVGWQYAALDARNEVLDVIPQGSRLISLEGPPDRSGKTMSELIGPDALSGFFRQHGLNPEAGLTASDLSWDGEILAHALRSDPSGGEEILLLTPPDMPLPLPLPIPEPTVLAVLSAGLGGTWLRAWRNARHQS